MVRSFIFDMQWHLKPQWGGYTWDAVAYPNVTGMLTAIHDLGIPIGVNLHDADGVAPFEAQYVAMAQALGIDPATGATCAFDISNRTYAHALHDIVLAALATNASQVGVEMWWTDFQQGLPGLSSVTGAPPTFFLNHLRFQNYSQPGSRTRGTMHSRFAGWGSHRYASGFGGDVGLDLPSLQFMVYFTATASNALFGWWGHEMMRNGGSPSDSVEQFVRFMQFGAASPIYTNWGNIGSDDNLWDMDPAALNATRQALLDRATTLPYRYTLGYVAHDTGLSTVSARHSSRCGRGRLVEVGGGTSRVPTCRCGPCTTTGPM